MVKIIKSLIAICAIASCQSATATGRTDIGRKDIIHRVAPPIRRTAQTTPARYVQLADLNALAAKYPLASRYYATLDGDGYLGRLRASYEAGDITADEYFFAAEAYLKSIL